MYATAHQSAWVKTGCLNSHKCLPCAQDFFGGVSVRAFGGNGEVCQGKGKCQWLSSCSSEAERGDGAGRIDEGRSKPIGCCQRHRAGDNFVLVHPRSLGLASLAGAMALWSSGFVGLVVMGVGGGRGDVARMCWKDGESESEPS